MKLRSCHIDNFGKLSDLHLEFQDGVNLFHEPNADRGNPADGEI